MKDIREIRAAFEAWCSQNNYNRQRIGNGAYWESITEQAWIVWQAALSTRPDVMPPTGKDRVLEAEGPPTLEMIDAVNAGAAVLNKYVEADPCDSYHGTFDWAWECYCAITGALSQPSAAGHEPDDEDETYEIGKRDGYEEAVQDIDILTGGDGEYYASTCPGEGCPDPESMKARIADRFSAPQPDTIMPLIREFIGSLCPDCKGKGEWNDADIGDISFNSYRCKVCKGIGATGLTGKVKKYLDKKSLGHSEVDCVAIASIVEKTLAANLISRIAQEVGE